VNGYGFYAYGIYGWGELFQIPMAPPYPLLATPRFMLEK
jgi:hypothetical protein